jgi:hypothetical protein
MVDKPNASGNDKKNGDDNNRKRTIFHSLIFTFSFK